MSNEYKDWYESFSEEQKVVYNICMEYPFLIPRDIEGNRDEDFEYDYWGIEIPGGWLKLFLQMCADLKPILEREGVLDDFYFLQVKEKYNRLECYPCEASIEVQDVIDKYSMMASYVCTWCGRPATCETQGYIASFCDDCSKNVPRQKRLEWIEFKPYYKVTSFANGGCNEKIVSFEDEWNRYVKENGYDTI